MKIVVATDSFKGTLTSQQAGDAIAAGIRGVRPDAEIVVVAVADGGEGTVEAVLAAVGGRRVTATVAGPLGATVQAPFAVLPDSQRAVIEMASASGLTLLAPNEYDPLGATTYGTGQLIRAAIDRGCRRIAVGVGGSATMDGGCGAAQALGVRFIATDGSLLPVGLGGGQLDQIHCIDLTDRDPGVAECHVELLCDVTNPLCGSNGAAAVFGPQKGATPQQVEQLDRNLAHLAEIVRRDLGFEVADTPGAGAAGGLPVGLMACAGAKLLPGVETILDIVRLDERLAGADLVVTGEGRIDGQSMMGKVISGVATRAKTAGVPAIAIAGCLGPDADGCLDFLDGLYAVCESPLAKLPPADEAAASLTRRAEEVLAGRASDR